MRVTDQRDSRRTQWVEPGHEVAESYRRGDSRQSLRSECLRGRSGPSAGARPRLRIVVSVLDQTLAAADRTQRSHRITAVAYGVVKKFGDDNLNQSVVGLGWYGCVGIYPLLLVVVTVFGFIGIPSL